MRNAYTDRLVGDLKRYIGARDAYDHRRKYGWTGNAMDKLAERRYEEAETELYDTLDMYYREDE